MIAKLFQTLKREEKGTFIVLMSLCLLGVFGFAALAIDISHVYQQKRDMQSATDYAALARRAALLTNSSPDKTAIIQAAQTIALSNGLTTAEITAAVSEDGTIEVGTWDTNNTPPFTANTASGTWNAVRVPAKRSVGLFFGKLTVGPGNGLSAMSPVVHTVAVLSHPNQAYDVVPFMMTTNYAGNPFGTQLDFTKNEYKNDGNFGKADLSSAGGSGDFTTDMQNGCNCTLSIGETINGDSGNSSVSAGLNDALGRDVIVPVVDALPKNNGAVTIVGFMLIHIDAVNGNGSWDVTFTLVSGAVVRAVQGATRALLTRLTEFWLSSLRSV